MPDPTPIEAHPEDTCHRCGGPNLTWYAPSPLWNEVMRGGDINGTDQFDGIVCPTCFAVLAEDAGIAQTWQLSAREIYCTLQTTTPSGRTWNATTWLWDDARPAADAGRAGEDDVYGYREIADRHLREIWDEARYWPIRERDSARKAVTALQAQLAEVTRERDETRAWAERLSREAYREGSAP